ncbi:hypothetical protein [Bacillus sp. ISL-7]|uniref:hypothetical protein n=1 Tax=Bacillus sp. ISL-7 TaxID=2819136 RepID=UPI001BE889DD|nr:hypothetical protein [Bacillus sp. ISL-7]MBT2737888.1 hypothetical protein [Bacillus sp. ISL-7]
MEEQKQYRDDLLEWCNTIYSNWESMKPKVTNLFDMERLEEWEGSCRQLKEKLQSDLKVDFDDYLNAKSLYDQWEQLFKETNANQGEIEVDSDQRLEFEEIEVDFDQRLEWEDEKPYHEELLERAAYQEEIKVDSDQRLEWEEEQPFHEGFMERAAYQEEIEVETDKGVDLDEELQYREELLEWCNTIYSNWESMKPRFSKLFDIKSLEEWEASCRNLKEKLQEDLIADFDDYQTAKSLYEQWEQLFKESNANKEAIGV